MKERPILFSGEMVRAILAGTKTVTRRVVRIPEIVRAERDELNTDECLADYTIIQQRDDGQWRAWMTEYPDEGSVALACPYGVPGDRLWVRETWRVGEIGGIHGTATSKEDVHYRADLDEPPADGCWRPSIFMTRWAARILLEVVSVRVERLQEISEEDAKREGVAGYDPEPADEGGTFFSWRGVSTAPSVRAHFMHLWEKLNGKRPGCSWSDNPFVWRVEFRRVEPAPSTARLEEGQ